MSEEAIERLLEKYRDAAKKYAKAKGDRVYLEQFRKSKKAMLVKQVQGTVQEREAHAYAHPDYLEVLDGIRAAWQIEAELMYRLRAAEFEVEIWRTKRADARSERAGYGA